MGNCEHTKTARYHRSSLEIDRSKGFSNAVITFCSAMSAECNKSSRMAENKTDGEDW